MEPQMEPQETVAHEEPLPRTTHHPKHTMRMSFLQRAKSFMDKITELTQDEEGQ